MGKEASLWHLFREECGAFGHFERIENRVNVGTPDVNYALNGARGEGWIELKDIDKAPARADTILRIEHVTEVQKEWWLTRARAGGRVWVLLRIHRPAREYLMFSGEVAARLLNTSTLAELRAGAIWAAGPGFPKVQILQQLTLPK